MPEIEPVTIDKVLAKVVGDGIHFVPLPAASGTLQPFMAGPFTPDDVTADQTWVGALVLPQFAMPVLVNFLLTQMGDSGASSSWTIVDSNTGGSLVNVGMSSDPDSNGPLVYETVDRAFQKVGFATPVSLDVTYGADFAPGTTKPVLNLAILAWPDAVTV